MLRRLYSAMRRRLGQWRAVGLLRKEYKAFLRSPKPYTDMRAQNLLRQGFVASRGRVLQWCYELQRKQSPHRKAAANSALFPKLDERAIESALAELRTNGFHVLPWRLPDEWVKRAVDAASALDVVSLSDKSDVQKPISLTPRSATYWHGPDVASIPEFQSFVNDRAIREIIGRYLECVPVFDMATAWWSFPAGAASSASAQMYHFDLDRVRWLKVFVYLTGVGVDNGPHAFVRGSHKSVGSNIWHDGRYTDEEVFKMYPKADEVVFTGPAGTVFIEDTLGFHKGIPVREGKRFVFEYEYSINCFGYPH